MKIMDVYVDNDWHLNTLTTYISEALATDINSKQPQFHSEVPDMFILVGDLDVDGIYRGKLVCLGSRFRN
jgi:hypothetical protein